MGRPAGGEKVTLTYWCWLKDAQKVYAEANFEYPVRAGAVVHPLISALGPLRVDAISLTEIARHRAAASRLVDKVGYDR